MSTPSTTTVREHFLTSTPELVARLACTLEPVGSFGVQTRALDVRVDDRRCSSKPMTEGSIPLNISVGTWVFLEADVPGDATPTQIRRALIDVRIELQRRWWNVVQTIAPPRETDAALTTGGALMMVLGAGVGVLAALPILYASSSHACTSRGCDPPPYEFAGFAVPIILTSAGTIVGGIYMFARGTRARPVAFRW